MMDLCTSTWLEGKGMLTNNQDCQCFINQLQFEDSEDRVGGYIVIKCYQSETISDGCCVDLCRVWVFYFGALWYDGMIC